MSMGSIVSSDTSMEAMLALVLAGIYRFSQPHRRGVPSLGGSAAAKLQQRRVSRAVEAEGAAEEMRLQGKERQKTEAAEGRGQGQRPGPAGSDRVGHGRSLRWMERQAGRCRAALRARIALTKAAMEKPPTRTAAPAMIDNVPTAGTIGV